MHSRKDDIVKFLSANDGMPAEDAAQSLNRSLVLRGADRLNARNIAAFRANLNRKKGTKKRGASAAAVDPTQTAAVRAWTKINGALSGDKARKRLLLLKRLMRDANNSCSVATRQISADLNLLTAFDGDLKGLKRSLAAANA